MFSLEIRLSLKIKYLELLLLLLAPRKQTLPIFLHEKGIKIIIFISSLPYYDCHGLLEKISMPCQGSSRGPFHLKFSTLPRCYKARLYSKAVQVYDIPNLYPVTSFPSTLNSSLNSQKYKNHWK